MEQGCNMKRLIFWQVTAAILRKPLLFCVAGFPFSHRSQLTSVSRCMWLRVKCCVLRSLETLSKVSFNIISAA